MISKAQKRVNHMAERGASYGEPFAHPPSFFLREDHTTPSIFRGEIFTRSCRSGANEPELSQSG